MAKAILAWSGAVRRSGDADLRRGLLLAALAAGAGLGLLAATRDLAAGRLADGELVELLRFMALLKAAMAAMATAAVWWRLAAPASPVRLSCYLAATAAMAAGPGLIWGLAHVGWGAVLLHGGLAAALVLLWRDPAAAAKLAEAVAGRRRSLARRASGPRDPSGADEPAGRLVQTDVPSARTSRISAAVLPEKPAPRPCRSRRAR